MKQSREPKMRPQLIWLTNIWQRSQDFSMGKDGLCNKWCCKNWGNICKTMNLDPYFTPLTKINCKWSKDLNIRSDIIKLLEETVGKKLIIWVLAIVSWALHKKAHTTTKKQSINGTTSNLKLQHSKRNNKMKTICRMGEKFCRPHIG